jgi:hypothetical protein
MGACSYFKNLKRFNFFWCPKVAHKVWRGCWCLSKRISPTLSGMMVRSSAQKDGFKPETLRKPVEHRRKSSAPGCRTPSLQFKAVPRPRCTRRKYLDWVHGHAQRSQFEARVARQEISSINKASSCSMFHPSQCGFCSPRSPPHVSSR